MRAITDAVLAFVDLIEAEGRAFADRAAGLFIAFALCVAGAVMMVIAAHYALGGVYAAAAAAWGVPAGSFAAALLGVVIGLAMMTLGVRAGRPRAEVSDDVCDDERRNDGEEALSDGDGGAEPLSGDE